MITITPKLAGLVAASAVALMAPVAFAANPHKTGEGGRKGRQAIQKSVKAAVWSFPACSTAARPSTTYVYSGDRAPLPRRPRSSGRSSWRPRSRAASSLSTRWAVRAGRSATATTSTTTSTRAAVVS